jgi:hypothetical protein
MSSSIISGLDSTPVLQKGENSHTEQAYSNEINEKITQFFFQLVRCSSHTKLEEVHQEIMTSIKCDILGNHYLLEKMYKLIGHTRDIISGKGEQGLSFMQIWGFYVTGYDNLAFSALSHFVKLKCDGHPFGSWKDIKYFCQYILKKTGDKSHPLIINAITLIIAQIKKDWAIYLEWERCSDRGEIEGLSLVGKWCPRGKSTHDWLHTAIAMTMFRQYIVTATCPSSHKKAIIKCRVSLTKIITTLNKQIKTIQINQCGGTWKDIDFSNVTSATMRNQSLAFANKPINGKSKPINGKSTVRSDDPDRILCAENLKTHIESCKREPNKHKIHGKRLNVYELVKDASEWAIQDLKSEEPSERDRINLQWEDNRKNNKGLGYIIPCSDVSYSMHSEEKRPLFSSIGLGIRCSELAHPDFRDRVLSFSSNPVWHNLSGCETFVDKVALILNTISCLGTNLYLALEMILTVIVEKDIIPDEVDKLVLAIFSDMQISEMRIRDDKGSFGNIPESERDTLYDGIEQMYREAGLRSKYQVPYTVPHILFWNLVSTTGFPVSSTKKNVTMLSGYSSTLLNSICDEGIESLKNFTPESMLEKVLGNKRYEVLSSNVVDYVCWYCSTD